MKTTIFLCKSCGISFPLESRYDVPSEDPKGLKIRCPNCLNENTTPTHKDEAEKWEGFLCPAK